MSKSLDLSIQVRKMGKKPISYSQYNMYKSCPRRWKLTYIDKHREFEPSIFLIFGTAIHEIIQEYLTKVYNETAVEADKMDFGPLLRMKLQELYVKTVQEDNDGKHYSTPQQLGEFYEDGIEILNYLRKKRNIYFSKKNCKLLGIEIPLSHVTPFNDKVVMIGFIDLVIQDGDELKIIDIKTSTMGWRKGQKAENGDQLRIYKEYFSKQYGCEIDKIKIEYFIVKRKLYENLDFPQRRIQIYEPPSGKPSMNKTNRILEDFVQNCFTEDGKYNKDAYYPATAGKNNKNCKYCEFVKRFDLCPKENRIRE